MQLNIRCLAAGAAAGLMNHDLAVGQRHPHAGLTGHQEEGTHGGGHAKADRANLGPDIAHGVKDRHAIRHTAARAVDVHGNLRIRILHFEEQELGNNTVCQCLVHLAAQENDTVLQQS